MSDAQAQLAALAALVAPFPDSAVDLLPRVPRSRRDEQRSFCDTCKTSHVPNVPHLDYVGHAHVTGRLLQVDPFWDWQPVAWDDDGLPRFTRDRSGNPVGLWIRLTAAGVTRLGYGSVEPGAIDAEKQLIGDAIRNSAMRFGVALDLWKKTREDDVTGDHRQPAQRQQRTQAARPKDTAKPSADTESGAFQMGAQWRELTELMQLHHVTRPQVVGAVGEFSATGLARWLEAEPGRTVEGLIATLTEEK